MNHRVGQSVALGHVADQGQLPRVIAGQQQAEVGMLAAEQGHGLDDPVGPLQQGDVSHEENRPPLADLREAARGSLRGAGKRGAGMATPWGMMRIFSSPTQARSCRASNADVACMNVAARRTWGKKSDKYARFTQRWPVCSGSTSSAPVGRMMHATPCRSASAVACITT